METPSPLDTWPRKMSEIMGCKTVNVCGTSAAQFETSKTNFLTMTNPEVFLQEDAVS